MLRTLQRFPALALVLLFLPSTAYAQFSGAITGVVKDASGGVLPGVTVEAASPALIEKVRSVVTDATGQYRIVDLRPGTYSVTFTLTGFRSVRREGIVLEGSFAAQVNASLQVGGLEELSVKAQRLLLVCRMISPQYFIAIVMAPEGNFGKARYLARLAQPALVAAL